jgi:inosose dehydratase
VWFPQDDHQVTWQQYLDEVPRAGYVWTELGPSGFLPQDPAQLRDELDRRGLRVCGGTVFAGLHRGADALKEAIENFSNEARLLTAVGGRFMVHLPEQYTDMHTGSATEAADLDREQWDNLVAGTNELGRVMSEEFGVALVFHPHADTHVDTQERVERFLEDTDPQYVNLCLDTGHIAYCGGDNVEIVKRFPDRITYVHLKQVDPVVRQRVRDENLSLAEAVPLGVMVEPPYGLPEMPPLLAALGDLNREIFAVIEQDLYPVEPDVPLPVAARTAGYFVACGLGPVRRWPYQPNGKSAA